MHGGNERDCLGVVVPVLLFGTLYAYSPNVVPVPSDWGDDVLVTGYWFLDSADGILAHGLSAFLDAATNRSTSNLAVCPGSIRRR